MFDVYIYIFIFYTVKASKPLLKISNHMIGDKIQMLPLIKVQYSYYYNQI